MIREVLRSRSYTINVAGFSVNVQEASDKLHQQIADLQRQVASLAETSTGGSRARRTSWLGVATDSAWSPTPTPPGARILWVDDKPANNAYEIQTLLAVGMSVVTARSTAEGLRQFADGHYFAVITDYGREEDGSYEADAGKKLIEAIRKDNETVPIYVFTTRRAVQAHEGELRQVGATQVTNSSVQLLAALGVVDSSYDSQGP